MNADDRLMVAQHTIVLDVCDMIRARTYIKDGLFGVYPGITRRFHYTNDRIIKWQIIKTYNENT
jgi:hypothetical protein